MTEAAAYHHAAHVRFSDTDAMGHVNHARALAYLEDARVRMLRGGETSSGNVFDGGVILARLEIDYLRPIEQSLEPLDVRVWVKHIGRSSFTLGYRVEQAGEIALRATSVLVAYDYAAASSRLLSDSDRTLLEARQVRG